MLWDSPTTDLGSTKTRPPVRTRDHLPVNNDNCHRCGKIGGCKRILVEDDTERRESRNGSICQGTCRLVKPSCQARGGANTEST